ncbi:MAG: 23S rRNA (adenine(2503)-C(2))-methyltransferase RlmN [Myxococcales bacterium]|nr:23S rRNA (adenine(2503)-C(2))-methyltransferase RlmN [Myxococcales bacterium]
MPLVHEPDLRSLSFDELSTLVDRMGEKPYRARQLFRWLHQRGAASFEEMTDLPKTFRERLAQQTRLASLAIDAVQQSSDGTRKYRLRTQDGKLIEAVYMPDIDVEDDDEGAGIRRTLCVSTQVGCAMGCGFCMTATMGLVRNLTAGEIVDQVHRVNTDLKDRPITNLVFMGMGEPLHNYANVMRALELLQHQEGLDISHRRITVSTSGLVPNIVRFGQETQVKLAVSLNATTDEQRARLMPVDRKWNIGALIDAVRKFPSKQGRRVTFEYVLLEGVNDTDDDAARLATLLKNLPVKVNLIPYNENPGLGFGDPGPERLESFRNILQSRGITSMVRKNRGRDIAAACGQLAVQGQRQGASA